MKALILTGVFHPRQKFLICHLYSGTFSILVPQEASSGANHLLAGGGTRSVDINPADKRSLAADEASSKDRI